MIILRALWVVAVIVLTFLIHEAAHGLAGATMGFDMIVKFNGARPADASGMTLVQRDLISAAGPAITVLQGFAAAWLASAWRPAFAIALSALMMRILAAVASLRNPNDEARLGLSWDLGFWTIHIVVIGALALAVLFAARRARPSWREAGATLFFIVIGMTLVVAVIDPQTPAVTIPAF